MSDLLDLPFEIPELNTDFLFQKRPIAIPGDLRPGWRIGLLVLLLHMCCRGGRTSLTRLHVLSWGIRTAESKSALRAAVIGKLPPDSLLVRFEPSLNRAVDFALGEGLIRREGGSRIELTDQGKRLAEELEKEASVFTLEKQFLLEIRQKVTEALINAIFLTRAS